MSTQFDRHPFDNGLTHNANLKVGGLETPCPACDEKDIIIEAMGIELEASSRRIAQLEQSANEWWNALASREAEIARLKGYLERAGWGKCNIPACNCNGWHHLRESREEREMQEQNRSLRALLERVPHDYTHAPDSRLCPIDCPRCAYEKLKP